MFTKTDATSLAAIPETEGATCSCASTESYIPSCCSRDRGCYMVTKNDATSLAAIPEVEVATCY
jgi:hypothetical protein